MKNIFLIPTDKPSRLYQLKNDILRLDYKLDRGEANKHIYITNQEEIKDCYVVTDLDKIVKVDKTNEEYYHKHNSSKIIITTDQDLIADGVQVIDDEFLEWFVKNPSCKEVEVKPLLSNNGRALFGYKIIIPKEEPNPHILSCCRTKEECYCGKYSKQETLEEVAERIYLSYENNDILYGHSEELQLAYKAGIVDGAKWQQERMYSEEEVLKSFDYLGFKKITSEELNSKPYQPFITDEESNIWVIDKDKWFNQFKK